MNGSDVNIRIEREHVARLDRLAAMKGVSRSVVLAAALTAYLSPESSPCEAAAARRFQRLARQLDHLKQGQTLLMETLAFFVRDYLAGTAPVSEPHAQTARALDRARFKQFIERLASHLQRDGGFPGEGERDFSPDKRRFAPPAEESVIRSECRGSTSHQ